MIGYITGEIIDTADQKITVLVGGIGYEIAVPSYEPYVVGHAVTLWTHHVIKEDASDIYGFQNRRDRDMLRKLITVSGVGPKGAMAMMASAPIDTLISAIQSKQSDILAKFPGIGKKTAEKICIELHNKLSDLSDSTVSVSVHQEALEALLQLGYKDRDILVFLQEYPSDGVEIEVIVTDFLRSVRS